MSISAEKETLLMFALILLRHGELKSMLFSETVVVFFFLGRDFCSWQSRNRL